ncbi:MAG TPA: NUDIX domain-containing protein [Mycobacteriales bacterium]|nr:NUDIX domain-containing protein [Mycobacteriales bacterium]
MPKPRAVAVVLRGCEILLMRRDRNGVDYHVLPGGGIERGESPEAACIRELYEETSLTARVEKQLWRIEHPDRTASYFLMTDVDGEVRLSGPEAKRNSPENFYQPVWVDRAQLSGINLQPAVLVERLQSLPQA